jgi:hypothetical protein
MKSEMCDRLVHKEELRNLRKSSDTIRAVRCRPDTACNYDGGIKECTQSFAGKTFSKISTSETE